MIQLFGRTETKKTNVYEQKSTLVINNVATGTMKFSATAVTALGIGDQYIGIACDEVPVDGGVQMNTKKLFYLHLSDEKNGFKVAKNGSFNSKYYARELATYFATGRVENIILDVDTVTTDIAEYPEIKFFRVAKSLLDAVEDSTKEEVNKYVEIQEENSSVSEDYILDEASQLESLTETPASDLLTVMENDSNN